MSHENKRTQYNDKSDYELVLVRAEHPPSTADHRVAVALLHERQIDREERKMAQTERSLWVAKVAVAVAAIGILVAIAGVGVRIWQHPFPVAGASATTTVQTATPTQSRPPPTPLPAPKQSP